MSASNRVRAANQRSVLNTAMVDTHVGRRSFLRAAVAGGAGMAVGTQASGSFTSFQFRGRAQAMPSPAAATPSGSTVLLAYFSRAGENYYHGDRIDLEVGNTKVVADMIVGRIGCDAYEIIAADPYPEDYAETRARNVREQDADARPEIANPLPSIDPYDTVILGSPIWNVRPPMIMSTFAEGVDFAGKTVLPLVTYAVSGLGGAERVYREGCPGATLGEALAVQGEQVIDAPDEAAVAVEDWLQRIGLLASAAATPSAP